LTDNKELIIGYYGRLRIDLAFFAQEGAGGERTEKPTQKKRNKARDEGQVVLSPEVATAFTYIVLFMALKAFSPGILEKLQAMFEYSFSVAETHLDMLDMRYAGMFVGNMLVRGVLIAMPLLLVAMGVGFISGIAQVGWNPNSKKLKVKFDKLNPINGVKRMFSFQAIMNLFKSLVKLLIIGMVIYNALIDEIDRIPGLIYLTLPETVLYLGDLIISLGIRVGAWFIAVAAVDFAYQKFKHEKDLKMSKYELKQEYKESEGDPQIKGKIRQRMQEASMRRMMQAVPEADVIITNPTHYAVAIKYDRNGQRAPVVVAKGMDFMAKRIKEKAKENNIEIVENKQLARALYAAVDINKEIPPELYQAVAEILAYVYKLKNVI